MIIKPITYADQITCIEPNKWIKLRKNVFGKIIKYPPKIGPVYMLYSIMGVL